MNAVLQSLLLLTVVAGALRAVRPGSLADRVIGIDVALLGAIGAFALHAVTTGRTWALDVLPVLGLLAIVGTLAVARAIGGAR